MALPAHIQLRWCALEIVVAHKYSARYGRLDRLLDSERAEDVIVDAMSDGATVAEYCIKLGISKRIHREYLKRRDDYAEIFSYAQTISEAWWDKMYKGAMFGKISLDTKLLLHKMGAHNTSRDEEYEEPKKLPPIKITFIESRVNREGDRIDENG